MSLNFRLLFKAGFAWGLIGVLLVLAFSFLEDYVIFEISPVGIGTFATMFAGIHFAREDSENAGISIFGGGLAGALAAGMMLGAAWFLSHYLNVGTFELNELGAILAAALSGIVGAFGMRLVDYL